MVLASANQGLEASPSGEIRCSPHDEITSAANPHRRRMTELEDASTSAHPLQVDSHDSAPAVPAATSHEVSASKQGDPAAAAPAPAAPAALREPLCQAPRMYNSGIFGYLFGWTGTSGFGSTSTCEQVLQGLDLTGKTVLITGKLATWPDRTGTCRLLL